MRSGGIRVKLGAGLVVWVNSVIIKVRKLITDIITCIGFTYKYNVKTCMYTISKLYQMINLECKAT